jgi:hypothetical protein
MLYRSKTLYHGINLIVLFTSLSSFAMHRICRATGNIGSMRNLGARNLAAVRNITNNSSKITSETSTNEVTAGKTYSMVYRFDTSKGLIRIKGTDKDHTLYPGCLYPNDCQNTTVTIERHASNEVTVEALLDKRIVELVDKGEDVSKQRAWHELHTPDNFYKENGWIWIPWLDNTITDIHNYLKKERNNSAMRGGNRLDLTLNEPGHYRIFIPHDADIEIDLSDGDIRYSSRAATELSIESSTVNYWGNSGSHGHSGGKWHYFWGPKGAPITELKTKKGHIELPRAPEL